MSKQPVNTQLKRLVIVESPTKAKTIRRFLPGNNFQIEASMGHVRDLPASAAEIPKEYKDKEWARLGVKIDENFEPLYIVSSGKKKIVSQLKSALKNADELYIATDEDREGESIGWHLVELLQPSIPVKRMVFHEITEEAILRALNETRDIDQNLVDAQETRRVLDRLVGYTISPLLWKKIAPKLSAGRVQSVAVRILVNREKERIAFVPASYWDLKAELLKTPNAFSAVMTHLNDIRLASGRDFDDQTGMLKEGLSAGRDVLLLSESEAKRLSERYKAMPWRVASVEERMSSRSPSPPFTTSTLQQEASRKLGLSARDTMRVAQGLYENGFITYMRTDSTNLAQEAIDGSRKAIEMRYGSEYLSDKVRQYTKKARNAQEAHEAIRPAGKDMRTKDELKLSGTEGALYDLIWKRTVATQMADAQLRFVTARIEVGDDENKAMFRASGRTTVFAGFFRAYVEGSDDPDAALEDREQPLPDLKEGDVLDCNALEALGHETKPPARFTEASLVKTLEQEGIGRPSTYASIIETIIRRGYVSKNGTQLVPTFTAFATNNLLERQFERLVNTNFTAQMEQNLDDIAAGALESVPYLKDFYYGSNGIFSQVEGGLEAIDGREISTLDFPQWRPYVVRVGRYGPYVEGELKGEVVTSSIPEGIAPADLTTEMLEGFLKEGNAADKNLGVFPETNEAMLLRRGPYGPYLQLGEDSDDKKKKPKRVSLPKGVTPAEVTPEIARGLLSLPRTLGEHPETGNVIQAHIGRFGPYVKHNKTFASLTKDDDVLTVDLPRALELIQKKEAKNKPLKVFGNHPETGEPVELRDGRYGLYVKHEKTNASLNSVDPDTLTLEGALKLLADREAYQQSQGKGKKSTKRKTTKKKTKAKTKSKAKSAPKPKATPKDLEPFLSDLDESVANVVMHVEGMKGYAPQDTSAVSQTLGMSEDDVKAAHKKGMFKLRMAYGRSRKQAESKGAA